MHDLVDHTCAQRALRGEKAPGQDHVEGSRKADEPGQPLRPARRGDEAETRLCQSDADVRCIRRDPRVAGEGDLEAAADRRSVDRRHRDERERGKLVECALHRTQRLLDVGLRGAAQ